MLLIQSQLSVCIAEVRLRKIVDERESLADQVKRLKSQLEGKQRNGSEGLSPEEDGLENGMDPHILDLQSESHFTFTKTDLAFYLAVSLVYIVKCVSVLCKPIQQYLTDILLSLFLLLQGMPTGKSVTSSLNW